MCAKHVPIPITVYNNNYNSDISTVGSINWKEVRYDTLFLHIRKFSCHQQYSICHKINSAWKNVSTDIEDSLEIGPTTIRN